MCPLVVVAESRAFDVRTELRRMSTIASDACENAGACVGSIAGGEEWKRRVATCRQFKRKSEEPKELKERIGILAELSRFELYLCSGAGLGPAPSVDSASLRC